jgi:hypothetical protein
MVAPLALLPKMVVLVVAAAGRVMVLPQLQA